MEGFGKQKRGKKKVTKVTTFPIPFALGEIKKHINGTCDTKKNILFFCINVYEGWKI